MLLLKSKCERCGDQLPPDSSLALICSFECTFCKKCANEHFKGICPNCGGNFEQRPIRPDALLQKYPPKEEE